MVVYSPGIAQNYSFINILKYLRVARCSSLEDIYGLAVGCMRPYQLTSCFLDFHSSMTYERSSAVCINAKSHELGSVSLKIFTWVFEETNTSTKILVILK